MFLLKRALIEIGPISIRALFRIGPLIKKLLIKFINNFIINNLLLIILLIIFNRILFEKFSLWDLTSQIPEGRVLFKFS